jgi:hypothetical protein
MTGLQVYGGGGRNILCPASNESTYMLWFAKDECNHE